MSTLASTPKLTIPDIQVMARDNRRLVMVTAYDYPSARLADEAGIDLVLVGDSAAMTVLGHPNTLAVTVDEMLVFTRAVSRACQRAMVVGDLPYGSYLITPEDAVRTGLRFIKDAAADAIKVEGGEAVAPTIRRLVSAGIPVMGHIGLTPQSLAVQGRFRVQGQTAESVNQLLRDARAVEQAGAFALVVEAVPAEIGQALTATISIPTIGIGAGAGCSGQVLVWHDMLGLYHGRSPRFARRYADLWATIGQALATYASDVREGTFPSAAHSYHLPAAERAAVYAVLHDAGVGDPLAREHPTTAAPID